mmetsp:Transcript_26313/g.40521  ORF Transcript_26313/g.40521 Transcript_26313/m.40521 type:complete len:205 (-) Transcript_26313:644-1258(-)
MWTFKDILDFSTSKVSPSFTPNPANVDLSLPKLLLLLSSPPNSVPLSMTSRCLLAGISMFLPASFFFTSSTVLEGETCNGTTLPSGVLTLIIMGSNSIVQSWTTLTSGEDNLEFPGASNLTFDGSSSSSSSSVFTSLLSFCISTGTPALLKIACRIVSKSSSSGSTLMTISGTASPSSPSGILTVTVMGLRLIIRVSPSLMPQS